MFLVIDFLGSNDEGCWDGKCVKYMSINDGEECIDPYYFMLCKEGSGCIRNSSSSTGYSCQKVVSSITDMKSCNDDSDCDNDAACECNTEVGKNQCIPYQYARKDILALFKKITKMEEDGNFDNEKYLAYISALQKIYYPFGEYARCIDYEISSDEFISSSSSPSPSSPSPPSSPSSPSPSSSSQGKGGNEDVASNMKPSFVVSVMLFVLSFITTLF